LTDVKTLKSKTSSARTSQTFQAPRTSESVCSLSLADALPLNQAISGIEIDTDPAKDSALADPAEPKRPSRASPPPLLRVADPDLFRFEIDQSDR